MGAVVIGMDPHKRSATIEVMDGDETILGGGRYATDVAGYQAMLKYGSSSRSGRGRLKVATGSGNTSRTGCWPTVSRSSMCHRSCLRALGCSPPVRAAKPMTPTRIRSRWSAPG